MIQRGRRGRKSRGEESELRRSEGTNTKRSAKELEDFEIKGVRRRAHEGKRARLKIFETSRWWRRGKKRRALSFQARLISREERWAALNCIFPSGKISSISQDELHKVPCCIRACSSSESRSSTRRGPSQRGQGRLGGELDFLLPFPSLHPFPSLTQLFAISSATRYPGSVLLDLGETRSLFFACVDGPPSPLPRSLSPSPPASPSSLRLPLLTSFSAFVPQEEISAPFFPSLVNALTHDPKDLLRTRIRRRLLGLMCGPNTFFYRWIRLFPDEAKTLVDTILREEAGFTNRPPDVGIAQTP